MCESHRARAPGRLPLSQLRYCDLNVLREFGIPLLRAFLRGSRCSPVSLLWIELQIPVGDNPGSLVPVLRLSSAPYSFCLKRLISVMYRRIEDD